MMEALAHKALSLWPITFKEVRLVARRENMVFQAISTEGKAFALRLHRPGYRTLAELQSELEWMDVLAKQGVSVPKPIVSHSGALVEWTEDQHIDLLTWLPGAPLGQTGTPLRLPDAPEVFFLLGQSMAKLHDISDRWTPPDTFRRHAWDVEGLLGDNPVWGCFWENPGLSSDDRGLVLAARGRARAELEREHARLDYGLIHADLVRENVLIDGGKLHLIDFDDGGFGYRLFDVATTLLKNRNEPNYAELEASLLAGYRTNRSLDAKLLPLFLLLRAFSYLGWITTRMDLPRSDMRNRRFLDESLGLARRYLSAPA